jgi:hypothetical protein|tara:strand:+ start:111 stop:347 length:237 start_codon:yes stop_codon:yes gene_type:complete
MYKFRTKNIADGMLICQIIALFANFTAMRTVYLFFPATMADSENVPRKSVYLAKEALKRWRGRNQRISNPDSISKQIS